MRRDCLHFGFSAAHHLIQNARVFVIVAVQAEQLPVTAVCRVVVVVVVFVVHRQFAQALPGKLAATPAAYPREQLERSLAITSLARLALLARFGDNTVKPCVIGSGVFAHGGWV